MSTKKKRQFILTYNAKSKMWTKRYKNQQFWILYSPTKTNREKYREAVRKWNRIKAEVDAGKYDAEKEARESEKQRLESVTKTGESKNRKYNPRLVKTAIRKFLKFQQSRVNSKQITPSRFKNLQYGLVSFEDQFGDRELNSITESDITRYFNGMSKRISRDEIKPSTLDSYFRAVRQFIRWATESRLIKDPIRNMRTLQVKIPKKKIHVYTKHEIQLLLDGIGKKNLHPRWQGRKVDHTILKGAILLGLNCGYTQMDISTLRVRDCEFNRKPPRIDKRRNKTGVPMQHLMWKETKKFLKDQCKGKDLDDLVFTRDDGKAIVPFAVDKDDNIIGGRSDWMGDKFTRLVKRVLGDDDPRRLRELRKTGADYVKQREVGIEKLYLGHTDSSMAGRYTKPAQKALDGVLCFMEKDFGFTDKLQPYYSKRVRQ